MIKILLSLSEEDVFNSLIYLNDELNDSMIKIMAEILENGRIPEKFNKELIYFLIEISINLKQFEKLPKELISIFTDFLEKEFLNLKDFDLSTKNL
jgi:transcriptional regulator of heat shock response